MIEKFDDWQQKMIDHKGSVTARCGRQVGKSSTAGKRRSNHMRDYPQSISLIIAPSQRQSSELYAKTMGWLYLDHYKAIDEAGGYKEDTLVSETRNMQLRRLFEAEHGIFNEIPTKTTIVLKNDWNDKPGQKNVGSKCYSLPAGKTGTYLRTYALDFLDVDEAAFVPEPVYTALKPMLAVSEKKRGLGWEGFYSTPFGKGGFFYDSFTDEDFLQFHVSSEDCPRISKSFLLKEKKRLTKQLYAQEYLAEFVDEYQQYFPSELIKKCMTFMRWDFKKQYNKSLKYFRGVDYAGPGEDDMAFVDAEMQKNKNLKIISAETDPEPNTSISNWKIELMDKIFNYNKILVDSGGFGCGPTDELIKMLGRKVIGLNNSKKAVDHEGERQNKILKEDLYSNAKCMMEQGTVEIINDLMLLRSLKNIRFEYTANKTVKIYGKDSHLAEAFVRACWAVKTKSLNLYVY